MFKSEAHKKKIQELHKAGKISDSQLSEFEKKSQGKKLPDRVKKEKKK